MNRKRRIHDGIVGTVIAVGVALGFWVNPNWLALPGAIGLAMVQSAFTGFCPVYFALDRLGIGEHSATTARST
jgi:hypothetical protein